MHFFKSTTARGAAVALLLLTSMALAPAAMYGQTAGSTLWPSGTGPTRPGGFDQASVELGVKFTADVAGSVNAIRFYKAAASINMHMVSLWASDGRLLGQTATTGETASGWQQANFSPPLAIEAGVRYVASYHTTGYTASQNYFNVALDTPPLHALSSGSSGGNGVFLYGPTSAMPIDSYLSTNYWVDVVFAAASPNTPTPTASPTPTSTPSTSVTATPTPGTGVAPTGFTCNEIIGFSETEQWYNGGFISSVPNPSAWQLRWFDGGSINRWAEGSAFPGWAPSSLVSHCATGSSAPGRIILTVSGDYNKDPAWWTRQTQAAINYVRSTYDPTVTQIAVQPVVGGPASSLCGNASNPPLSWVRASYNFPAVKAGLNQVLDAGVVLGADPQVRSCADYLDGVGHLVGAATPAIGAAIAGFYTQPPR